MYDWPDAAHFGAKAVLARQGQATPPERLKDWRLPAEKLGEMTAARGRLMAEMEKGAPGLMPRTAARAQARFDCWVEQQEENWQTDHIALCRSGFYAALTAMEAKLLIAAAESPALPAALSREAGPPAAEAFVLFFQFDSAQFQPGDGETLDDIARAAKQGGTVHILLSGHADRAGPGPYNMALSRSRAETVRHALAERGVETGRMALSAHGESNPRVTTADGVREPRNRRVEIIVGPAPSL
jgi:OOP family OmpA-OmpF porin